MCKKFIAVYAIFVLTACDSVYYRQIIEVEAPEEVRVRVIDYAREYIALNAEYEFGGQDPLPRTITVDCSGLVIRCYQYACEDYGYQLLFYDTTSYGLLEYVVPIEQAVLTPGDLIFMGDDGVVSHVALFVSSDGADIAFIDSTYKPEENINGVSERSYAKDDPRFISYGRMLIGQYLTK
jgi:hypothetical protein